ncbi:MAG: hypothetical protein KDB21_14360, partial [Acidimicrobiales bacterium]|nr:hypothetical protein [Acidimicrobiales bacterium]
FGSSAQYVIDIQGFYTTEEAMPSGEVVASAVLEGSGYSSITPCRVVDTRQTSAGAFVNREIRTFQVAGSGVVFAAQGGQTNGCGIPSGAVAVEASITAVSPSGSGFFRAWPAGESMPNATFLNYAAGQDITNTGTIPLGDGDMTVRNFGSSAQYVIDIQGFYTTDSPTPVAIAAGRGHACALMDDATLRCWGSNAYGQRSAATRANG